MSEVKRFIVALTGATGSVIGVRMLERLQQRADAETHLVISPWGRRTLEYETELRASDVEALADFVYKPNDMWSPIASGSFRTDAMIIAPCSMRTLASIATGTSDSLISRAADVMLKEQKKIVIVPRETPLNVIHLDNMSKVARAGALLMPPVMTFYNHPKGIDDMVDHLVQRVFDQVGISENVAPRWLGRSDKPQSSSERE